MSDAEQVEAASSSPEERARKRLAAEKGFYVHLAVYVTVICFLFVINLITGSRWWFVWPALGWGIGIALHAMSAFGLGSLVGHDWEERRLRELIEQERERR